MKNSNKIPISSGIGFRIALISWLVSIGTLAIFVVVIIPQQKAIFFEDMESKSRSLEASVHHAIEREVISEDVSSLVKTSRALLEGDSDLEFLVIVKGNDFVLIIRRNGWEIEKTIDKFWVPEALHYASAIDTTPILDRPVFHHAHPIEYPGAKFEYSGVKWGWLHIGLSLDNYNQRLQHFYHQTFLLSLSCAVISLLLCLGYARQLVKPITRLRNIVYQIANGNLNVRAESSRKDEIGSLADSVNDMTEGLLYREMIIDSVRYAAQHFLQGVDWQAAISPVLEKMGQSINASRVYVFENTRNDKGQLCMSRRCEWVAENTTSQMANPELQNLPYAVTGLGEEILSRLGQNEAVSMLLSEMSDETRAIVEPLGICSVILVPIMVGKEWWGFIGLDDCIRERVWLESGQDSICAIADMLGTAIGLQQAQQSLLEANATLEERVEKRTRELRDQVTAKEQAMRELAETQSSLLEMSRAAGMAEVATGVLHNVGNVLNSVNVSSNLVWEQVRQSRIGNVSKVAELLKNPEGGLARFLTEDSRGKQIPAYLDTLAAALQKEHRQIADEVEALRRKIDHIKEIVSMQQTYGRVLGVVETIDPQELMEDALTLNKGGMARHQVDVVRDYQEAPAIVADKHTIMQILLNFITNAKYACSESDGPEKKVTLRVFSPAPDRVAFQVQDTGVGILPENMDRIFQHGFTTRKKGHGFGLHSGALAARTLGGEIGVASDGPGCGATFTLEVPVRSGENA
ncbi:MAG: histidine kinase [Gammaproteobacteria bacterium]|nr:MAG: histidine kinase [Pseudomonadota bacterium]PIE38555.1 MAG: histidine kinase [Gammaproteobacteria bacterium]